MPPLCKIGILTLLLCLFVPARAQPEPKMPLSSGQYNFKHRYAEQPNIRSLQLRVKITGKQIVVINVSKSSVFPKGPIAQGTIMWHAKSRKWIIGENEEDKQAEAVGGCSDGPEVIDLINRIYWTC